MAESGSESVDRLVYTVHQKSIAESESEDVKG